MPVSISGSGSITGVSTLTQLTTLDVTGSVNVGGILTYEDVTNIDSIGIITARSDVIVGGGLSVTGITTSGGLSVTGITTSTSTIFSNQLSVSGIVTSSQYSFSTQGFTFELKDGILTPSNKTKYTYSYTGSNQTLVVPVGVNWIFVKLWGAGGGAGRAGGWSYGADGGGGGHTRGLFPVTPGDTLIFVIGRGGTTVNGTTQSYGGGGTNGSAANNSYGGHGGGYCGVFINNSVSQANALAIAGGGGGGGCSRLWVGNIGGAGGGTVGQRGSSPYDGKFSAAGGGGSQSAGGSGSSSYTTNGSAGSALQGGAGAPSSYGGGGGGGYYGGGGGSYSESNTMGGGGGGSGFVKSTGLLTETYTGNYRNVAYSWDPDLLTTTTDIELPGFGGQNTQNNQSAGDQSGGHAYAVVYY